MAIDTDLPPLRYRRTKIVATLGPASDSAETIAALVDRGVDVFRLNMSHGDHPGHQRTFERVRAAAHAAGRHIAVLADLAGPKIRVGRFEGGGIDLVDDDSVVVTTRSVTGAPGLIPSQYPALAEDVAAGDRILLADGALELRVTSVDGTEIACTVVQGGRLGDRKGINLPGVEVSAPCLTDKDREDAAFALELGVDFLGLSFVRRGSDVAELRAVIEGTGRRTAIVAKIERPEALDRAEEILALADAVMVARGDLGVELPPEQVPTAQQQLIDLARRRNRPVIVATQMLESMIDSPRPTRAEVSDVSNAVVAGTDAIMLSGETASGAYPLLAVEMMNRIARHTEAYLWHQGAFEGVRDEGDREPPIPFGDAVAHCLAQLSRDLRVRAVVALSRSGMSAATMSGARPAAPVVAVSPSEATCRAVALMWGIIPLLTPEARLADPVDFAREVARSYELAAPGEYILLVQGFHAEPARNTPSITLISV